MPFLVYTILKILNSLRFIYYDTGIKYFLEQKEKKCKKSWNVAQAAISKVATKKTRTLNAYEKYATLIFVSFAFRERYFLRRNKLRKISPIGD